MKIDIKNSNVSGLTPNCILYQIKTQQGPYTYDELQAILATPEWS